VISPDTEKSMSDPLPLAAVVSDPPSDAVSSSSPQAAATRPKARMIDSHATRRFMVNCTDCPPLGRSRL
jgi:hypothetical protein